MNFALFVFIKILVSGTGTDSSTDISAMTGSNELNQGSTNISPKQRRAGVVSNSSVLLPLPATHPRHPLTTSHFNAGAAEFTDITLMK